MGEILLLDVGNTQLKIGIQFSPELPVELLWTMPIARIREDLPSWLAHRDINTPLIFGSNVASSDTATLIEDIFHPYAKITWLKSEPTAYGLINSYTNPSQLGSDRWMTMTQIWHRRSNFIGPRMIISCGTATTIDNISPEGVFLGGLILPGWNMMLQSLAKGTANLPFAQCNKVAQFPQDTHSAIISGCMHAQLGAIWQQLRILTDAYGIEPECHATGGAWFSMAQSILSECQHLLKGEITYHPYPVLEGIAITARNTTK